MNVMEFPTEADPGSRITTLVVNIEGSVYEYEKWMSLCMGATACNTFSPFSLF